MPVLNEAEYLERAVERILLQDYPAEVEIVLALGPSTDGTNEIADQLAQSDPRVRLVANPDRDIPIALNLAIAHTSHPIIVRVDAHSDLSDQYTLHAVRSLIAQNASNVGGVMSAAGDGPVQEAIARGYNSPYGLGGGAYHGDGEPAAAESAYLGVFRRDAVLEVGGYDPAIRRGEDWELNLRLRQAGHLIWFDPSLKVTYWPRSSWIALIKQFFATGVWRAVITRKYPSHTPFRFFVPGTLVLTLIAVLAVAVLQLVSVAGAEWSLVYLIPAMYLIGIIFAVSRMPGLTGFLSVVRSAMALILMHVSWGAGFLVGTVRGGKNTVDRSRT